MVSNLAKFRIFLGKTCFPLLSCASGTPYKEKKGSRLFIYNKENV